MRWIFSRAHVGLSLPKVATELYGPRAWGVSVRRPGLVVGKGRGRHGDLASCGLRQVRPISSAI